MVSVDSADETESLEFWRVALVRSLYHLVSQSSHAHSPNNVDCDLLGIAVLEGAGVAGVSRLDLELDGLVLKAAVGVGLGHVEWEGWSV